jgi:hypothetical protein
MKLILENWRGYLREEEIIDEGLKDWWNAVRLDIAAMQLGDKPIHTMDLFLSKIRKSEHIKDLKGESLIKFFKSLQAVLPGKSKFQKGPVGLGTPEADSAHRWRQLEALIRYAESHPDESLEDITRNATVKHTKAPGSKELATSLTILASMFGSVVSTGYAAAQTDPTFENKNRRKKSETPI